MQRDLLVMLVAAFTALAGSLVLAFAAHLNLTNERLPPTTTILETLPQDASDAAFGLDGFGRLPRRYRVGGGTLELSGWAYDRRTRAPFSSGAVLVDGRVERIVYGTPTVSVAVRAGTPVLARTGWYVRFPPGSLGSGAHVLSFAFVCQDDLRADVVRNVATIVNDPVARTRSTAAR